MFLWLREWMILPRSTFGKGFCIHLGSQVENQNNRLKPGFCSNLSTMHISGPIAWLSPSKCWLQVESIVHIVFTSVLWFPIGKANFVSKTLPNPVDAIIWKGEETNRPFSKVCGVWKRALGCFTCIQFSPSKSKGNHIPLFIIISANIYWTLTGYQLYAKYFANISCSSQNSSTVVSFYKGGSWRSARFTFELLKFPRVLFQANILPLNLLPRHLSSSFMASVTTQCWWLQNV